MAYNRWTFYGESEELKHYGVLGMRWGVHKARYYERQARKYANWYETKTGIADKNASLELFSKYEKRRQAVVDKLRKKSTEKLEKYHSAYKKKQLAADRKYASAQRKEYGILANRTKAGELYGKADKRQYKANRVAYKGKRFYDEMVRAYKDVGIDMDSDTAKLGKDLVDRIEHESITYYVNAGAKHRR